MKKTPLAILLFLVIFVPSILFAQGTGSTWNMGGNSTSNGNNSIGTNNQIPFKIKTNDTTRVTITEDGKMGIMNDQPTETLDVEGGMRISEDGRVEGDLEVYGTTTLQGDFFIPPLMDREVKNVLIINSDGKIIAIHPSALAGLNGGHVLNSCTGTAFDWIAKGKVLYAGVDCPEDQVGIGTREPEAKLDLRGEIAISGSRLHVNKNGMVGIGTATPQSSLHVYQNAGAFNLEGVNQVFMQFYLNGYNNGRKAWVGFGGSGTTDFSIRNENTGGNIKLLSSTIIEGATGHIMLKSTASGSRWVMQSHSGASGAFHIRHATSDDFYGNPHFSIHPNGSVGIGRVNPNLNYKLDVGGAMLACRINVEASSWCDYVFEEDYNLLPIEEFSTFIKTNKHLPGMPSEAELLETGIDVAEMFRMQQKIIEEYGLYIELLNEKIKKLEEKVQK